MKTQKKKLPTTPVPTSTLLCILVITQAFFNQIVAMLSH